MPYQAVGLRLDTSSTSSYTVPSGFQFIGEASYIGGSPAALLVNSETVCVVGSIKPLCANDGDVIAVSGSSAAFGLSGLLFPTTYTAVCVAIDVSHTTYTVPANKLFIGAATFVGGTGPAVILDGVTIAGLGAGTPRVNPITAMAGQVWSGAGSAQAYSLSGLLYPN